MNKIIKEEIERLAEVYVTKTYGAKQETWKPTERAIAITLAGIIFLVRVL